ncbi:hypothetical protein J3F84DRAFT_226475 [Trichoderma pleuroticola]
MDPLVQVTGKRLGIDKSYDERCDATARATNRSYCIRLWPLRTCLVPLVLMTEGWRADAQSVLTSVDIQKYRVVRVLAQDWQLSSYYSTQLYGVTLAL